MVKNEAKIGAKKCKNETRKAQQEETYAKEGQRECKKKENMYTKGLFLFMRREEN